jgi:hypothetical protein
LAGSTSLMTLSWLKPYLPLIESGGFDATTIRRLIHRPREAFRCHAFEQKTKGNQRTTAALAHVLKSGPRPDNV